MIKKGAVKINKKEYGRSYYEKHREKILEYMHRYYKEHKNGARKSSRATKKCDKDCFNCKYDDCIF